MLCVQNPGAVIFFLPLFIRIVATLERFVIMAFSVWIENS